MGNVVSSSAESIEEDIGNALFEKVRSFHEEDADKITGMLLEMPPKDLKNIIADETQLMSQIYEAIKVLDYERQLAKLDTFGDALYPEVEAVYSEPEVAEKITGMLLELDMSVIELLLQNKSDLLIKIHEAFEVLQTSDTNNEPKRTAKECHLSKTELGEIIFERLLQWYTDDETTAKLTGMLLEMNINEVKKLTQNDELLKSKANEAYKALTEER